MHAYLRCASVLAGQTRGAKSDRPAEGHACAWPAVVAEQAELDVVGCWEHATVIIFESHHRQAPVTKNKTGTPMHSFSCRSLGLVLLLALSAGAFQTPRMLRPVTGGVAASSRLSWARRPRPAASSLSTLRAGPATHTLSFFSLSSVLSLSVSRSHLSSPFLSQLYVSPSRSLALSLSRALLLSRAPLLSFSPLCAAPLCRSLTPHPLALL